jgi:hypothetical protein
MVRNLVCRDHAEGNVLCAAALDPARRAHTDRICIEQQRDHHLRIVCGSAPAVRAIGRVETIKIELGDRVEHEPGEVILRQPLPETRRQQQLLVAVTREEVLGHYSPRLGDHPIVPTGSDEKALNAAGLCDTLRAEGVAQTLGVWQ